MADLSQYTDPTLGPTLFPFDPDISYPVGDTIAHWLRQAALGSGTSIKQYASVADMASAVGFVEFDGETVVSTNTTISVPVIFRPGSYVTIDSGVTLTIRGPIQSPRQYIFRGAGSVVLAGTSAGQPACITHISWFNGVPDGANAAPAFNAAFSALSATSMGLVLLDTGTYDIESTVNDIPSVVWIKGSGFRETFIRATTDIVTFTLAGSYSRITDLSFNTSLGVSKTTAYISAPGNYNRISDISVTNSDIGVILSGNANQTERVHASYSAAPHASTSAVVVVNGTRNKAIDTEIPSIGTIGPAAVVAIGLGASASVTEPKVRGVRHYGPSASVAVLALTAAITAPTVSDFTQAYLGGSGTPDATVVIRTASTYSINGLRLFDGRTSAYCTDGILIDQSSSGAINDAFIDNIYMPGDTGYGINVSRIAGNVANLRIGDGVVIPAKDTKVYTNGTNITVQADPAIFTRGGAVKFFYAGVADDAYWDIPLYNTGFSAKVSVFTGTTAGVWTAAECYARLASTSRSHSAPVVIGNALVVDTELDATTATDGFLTVCCLDSRVRVINRLGSSRNVGVQIGSSGPAID
jgi:hypothetical protein